MLRESTKNTIVKKNLIEDYLRCCIVKEWQCDRIGLSYTCEFYRDVYRCLFEYGEIKASANGESEGQAKVKAYLEFFKELKSRDLIDLAYVFSKFKLPSDSEDYFKLIADFFKKQIEVRKVPNKVKPTHSFYTFFIDTIEIQIVHESAKKAYKILYHFIRQIIIEFFINSTEMEKFIGYIKRIDYAKKRDLNKTRKRTDKTTNQLPLSNVSPIDNVSSSSDLTGWEEKSRKYIHEKGLGSYETFLIEMVKNLEYTNRKKKVTEPNRDDKTSANNNDNNETLTVESANTNNSSENSELSEIILRYVGEFFVINDMDSNDLDEVQAICVKKISSMPNRSDMSELNEKVNRICEIYFKRHNKL